MVICFSFFNKKYCITITLNHAHFLDKFQISVFQSKGIVVCCSKIIYHLDMKFKSCFNDILMFIYAKSKKIDAFKRF